MKHLVHNNTVKAFTSILSGFILGCFLVYSFNFINKVPTLIYLVLLIACAYLPYKDILTLLKEQGEKPSFYNFLVAYRKLPIEIKILRYCFVVLVSIIIVKHIDLGIVLLFFTFISAIPSLLKSKVSED